MLRQLSHSRRRAFPRASGATETTSATRFSSTDRTESFANHCCFRFQQRQHQQQRRPDGSFYYHTSTTRKTWNRTHEIFRHRDDRPSFHRLRACYFSNAAERTLNGDDKNDDESDSISRNGDQISQQLLDLFIDHENDPSFSFVRNLKSWYLEHHGEIGSVVQDAFDTQMIQNPKIRQESEDDNDGAVLDDSPIRQIFTATFTCPRTNERFEAGRLPGYFDIDNQNFYTKKKTSLQAVSAVVLSHKLNGGNNNSDALLEEEDLHRLNVHDQSSYRQTLQRLYMKKFRISPTREQNRMIKHCFAGKEHGGTWWTSEFTCPVTGRIDKAADLPNDVVPDSMKLNEAGRIWYQKKSDAIHAAACTTIDSIDWDADPETFEKNESVAFDPHPSIDFLGPLEFWYASQGHTDLTLSVDDNFVVTGSTDESGRDVWTASFLCPLTGERFDSGNVNAADVFWNEEIGGLNWYQNKDAAVHAASLRAYDFFKHRDTGVVDPRFCREDPSQTTQTSMGNESGDSDDDEISGDFNDDTKDSFSEDDEDGFIIEVVPQQLNLSQGLNSGSSATLDVIAQAWVGSMGFPNDKGNSKHEIGNLQNALDERRKTINRAMEWVSQKKNETAKPLSDRTQFDIEGQVCNLKIANAILCSLADIHQRIPFDPQPAGVEDCATAILENMWSSPSTTPDAQSYVFYLKCLEGETPGDIAQRAQSVLSAMESGHGYNGRTLPKPTDSIYSTVAELEAFSGMDPSLKSTGSDSLDRNIHLCQLSAMAHNPSSFEVDLATEYIDRMETLSRTNNCQSLQPDIEAYNAPLRWSGGSQWSRTYSRVIPWDSYNQIYKDGFKSEKNIQAEHKQAEDIERWIEIIKNKALDDTNLAPNIETYESLIQAWVRCGSLEGLKRAEAIAKNLIAGEYFGVQPRSQSFYPILAAWVYSGCDEGPSNVESWINLMQEVEPEIDPESIFPNLPIMAQISLQRRNAESSGDSSLDRQNCIFDSATKCSSHLASAIDQHKQRTDNRMLSDTFVLVINVWYNAASAAISNGKLEEARMCSREIQTVVDMFDDLVIWLYRLKGADRGSKSNFSNLLTQAPSVYGAQLSVLNELESSIAKSQHNVLNDNGITKHLVAIEEKVRRLEELLFFTSSNGNLQNFDSELNTMSPFPSETFMVKSSCKSWGDIMNLSLNSLEKGTNNFSIRQTDFVRICMLIARVTANAPAEILDAKLRGGIIDKIVYLLETFGKQNKVSEATVSAIVQSLKKHPGSANEKEIKTLHSDELRKDDTDDEPDEENGYVSGAAQNGHTQRKVRRKRARGNDSTNLHRTSHTRSRVPNRALRRRPRPHQAKAT